mgnify:CR=1 FL=1
MLYITNCALSPKIKRLNCYTEQDSQKDVQLNNSDTDAHIIIQCEAVLQCNFRIKERLAISHLLWYLSQRQLIYVYRGFRFILYKTNSSLRNLKLWGLSFSVHPYPRVLKVYNTIDISPRIPMPKHYTHWAK